MYVTYGIHTSTVWRRHTSDVKNKKQRIQSVWDLIPLGAKEATETLKSLKEKNNKGGVEYR